MQIKTNRLGLFAKFWEPGKVKTRLAGKIGNPNAAKVYHAFLLNLLRNLNRCGDSRTIAYAPAEKETQFLELVGQENLTWSIQQQTDGGLGERMTRFFKSQLDAENTKVVLIGSDCLEVDSDTLERAFAALNENEVVLGPSFDGGYYLVGMSVFRPEIFRDIAWSTETVLEQTIERMTAEGISHSLLEQKHDIDHREDLVQLRDRMNEKAEADSKQTESQADAELLQVIQSVLAQS